MPKLSAPKWGPEIETSTGRRPKSRTETHPHLVPFDSVQEEEIKWLWYPYIPFGKVTTLDGDPGIGKSWISCAIASALTTGTPLPGQKTPLPPQRVLMLSAEDGIEDTLLRRTRVLGADLSRIAGVDNFFFLNEQGLIDMAGLMSDFAAAFVIIDPITAFMGEKRDMNKANEVRGLMAPLGQLAQRSGAAIVVVRHLRKGGAGDKAIYRGLGSIDGIAAVRSGLLAEETQDGRLAVFHIKSNLARKGLPIEYALGEDTFEWKGFLQHQEKPGKAVSSTPKAYKAAKDFLRSSLAQGPMGALLMEKKAEEMGISLRTLSRAKSGLVRSVKTPEGWVWELLPGMSAVPSEPEPGVGAALPDPESLDDFSRLLSDAQARMAGQG